MAGDITSGLAYIIPAYKVFDDIELRFGSRPVLPAQTVTDKSLVSELTQELDDILHRASQRAGAEIAQDLNEADSKASRHTGGDTSSPKITQALREPIPPAIPVPSPSFIVKIQEISPNYQFQPSRAPENPNGFFVPPDRKTAFYEGDPTFFRWQRGRISTLPDASDHLTRYSAATIFSQQEDTDHLLAVNINALLNDVASYPPGWRVLSFDYVSEQNSNSTYSSINVLGEERHLAAPGSPAWMGQLLPHVYNYQPTTPNGRPIPSPTTSAGLTGSLPILIGLAAFSAPKKSLTAVLSTSIMAGAWKRHNQPTGRTPERGMVVTVYYDPNNPHSTKDILDRLESGVFGPFYA